MSPVADARRTALSRREWSVLALLVISGFLNYFDRANLSAGASDIQRDLGLSYSQIGQLLGAFFWTYALCQLFAFSGWLVDRFSVGWILALGFFLWSAATAVTGLAQTFVVVFFLRLVLGVGESIAYPSYSRILANHYPEHHRGFANALIDAGTKCGPALGTLLGGLLIHRFGWRVFFLSLGFASFAWLAPWLVLMPRGKRDRAVEDPAKVPSIAQVFRRRSAIFSALGLFCSNYFWYFLLTWLPLYLQRERHFSTERWAVMSALAYFLIALSSVISGRVSDLWIARGATPTRVRKTFTGAGLVLSTMILPVVIIRDPSWAMALLMLTCLCYGVFTSNIWAITQTLAGPCAAGKWTAGQNGVGNLAGVVAAWLTGWLVQTTGQFYLPFLVTAVIALAGAGFFVIGIDRIEPVDWSARS